MGVLRDLESVSAVIISLFFAYWRRVHWFKHAELWSYKKCLKIWRRRNLFSVERHIMLCLQKELYFYERRQKIEVNINIVST